MSEQISADQLMRVLPLLYETRIGEGDQPLVPDVDDLYARCKIDPVDLDGELTEQSALYAWWATLAAEADYEADRAQQRLGVVEAEVVSRLREEGNAATLVDKLVKGQPDYAEALEVYLLKKRNARVLSALVRSLEHRREMLVALVHRRNRDFEAARDSV